MEKRFRFSQKKAEIFWNIPGVGSSRHQQLYAETPVPKLLDAIAAAREAFNKVYYAKDDDNAGK